jgi:hypothetical protein
VRTEQRLRHELQRADAVVCAITSAYLQSKVCRDEVEMALSFGRLILPVQGEPDLVHPLLKNTQYVGLEGAPVQLLKVAPDRRRDG